MKAWHVRGYLGGYLGGYLVETTSVKMRPLTTPKPLGRVRCSPRSTQPRKRFHPAPVRMMMLGRHVVSAQAVPVRVARCAALFPACLGSSVREEAALSVAPRLSTRDERCVLLQRRGKLQRLAGEGSVCARAWSACKAHSGIGRRRSGAGARCACT